MEITIDDLPCYEEGAGDEGIYCGAFKSFVASEAGRYSLRATAPEAMVEERAAIVDALHRRFIEDGFCLLQRALTEESRGQVGVAVNPYLGRFGDCPPLDKRRQAKNN